MDAIQIEAADDTPEVVLNAKSKIFKLSGRSIPEDATTFYAPILQWLDAYAASPNATTKFVFELEYLNTASAKSIFDIMLKLEEMHKSGSDINIVWLHKKEDKDMEKVGSEYAEMVELPFEEIAY